MKVKNSITDALLGVIAVALIVLGIWGGFKLTGLQVETLKIVGIVAVIAAAYCFVVGEISRNNSQMDKLWSILPEVYLWIVAVKSGMEPRIVVMAVIATLWGARLTYNFARKGAYSIKFWAGEEDYRWILLRQKKGFSNKFVWAIFDLLFISIYQNFVVLAITLPAIAAMGSGKAFGGIDVLAAVLAVMFLVLELIADEQQWKFHSRKKELLKEGKKLGELPLPYSRGFNTIGIWSCSRHPNYLGEQGIWVSMYLFAVGAGVRGIGMISWSILGSMLLILIFLGSSSLAENISSGKYPEYPEYKKRVSKYIPMPWKKYD